MKQIEYNSKDGKVYSYIRQKWLVETPEEQVRQRFLLVLVNHYCYDLEQIAEEESVTGRGSARARADFLIWRTVNERRKNKPAFIVVECKADYVTISEKDYQQGENYARREGADIFITHNSKETKVFQVQKHVRPGTLKEIEDIPVNGINDIELEKLYNKLKELREDEFANILSKCHNIIRNREKLDPAAAFDEIAKILFMKVYAERVLAKKQKGGNVFSLVWIDEAEKYTEDFLTKTFEDTKKEFAKDTIFAKDEKINLRDSTIKSIIRELEPYNLSKTSEDIKGIAFERFLGKTFRGEIGQFFTPRPVVDFMVEMIDPQIGEVICDPASGSGGFLIKVFEKVRAKIEDDIKAKYQDIVYQMYRRSMTEDEIEYVEKSENDPDNDIKLKKLLDKQKKILEKNALELQEKKALLETDLNVDDTKSQIWHLSNRCLYGTDANERMARTSKMNMIMHGDGHGGIHHHDGFLNINGIFEDRFDVILTNPPFGSSVEKEDQVRETDISNDEMKAYYQEIYKDAYEKSVSKIKANIGKPITSLFDLPRGNSIKTELLFIERCLSLLQPEGRLGIVLPEGVLNTPSLAYVREFAEDRAFLSAVVSLPQDTFLSSGASVKASLVFMQKFSHVQKSKWDSLVEQEKNQIRTSQSEERDKLNLIISEKKSKSNLDNVSVKSKKEMAKKRLKELDKIVEKEGRLNAKKRFNYYIFMAESEHAGITSTGDVDMDSCDFPTILDEYRKFLISNNHSLNN